MSATHEVHRVPSMREVLDIAANDNLPPYHRLDMIRQIAVAALAVVTTGGANPTTRELPRYQSHKIVEALKIKEILDPEVAGFWSGPPVARILTFSDEGFASIRYGIPADWVRKHNPQPGGYYVIYPDGYTSFSPAQAFEEGYTRLVTRDDDAARLMQRDRSHGASPEELVDKRRS